MTYNFDPEFVDALAQVPDLSIENVGVARATLTAMAAHINSDIDLSGVDIGEHMIAGPTDAPLRVRLYTPKQRAAAVPGLLCIHSGGFVIGSLDTEHASLVALCEVLGVVIASVDYRLAPEHPYPAGLEDCYSALTWFSKSAESLGVDNNRIGVYGLSAGGGLSAALALLTRDRSGPKLCFQYLGVPELDDRLQTTSMRNFIDTPLWSRVHAELSWKYYLGDKTQPGAADVPIYAAPARATDLRGLPPTYIVAAEFDPLRDENIIYALNLLEAGVPTELHVFAGTFHGSQMFANAEVSKRQLQEAIVVLQRGLRIV
ncbi:MAG: esterase [Verrucomicrobiaceae bacterium]|nr:esterase [Verrucomicrobiaceae bacterium]